MRLTKLTLQGFRCFDDQHPATIDFTTPLTTLIGRNGSGKTAVLLALARMFGAHGKHRAIVASDFHVPFGETERPPKRELALEAFFELPEYQGENAEHIAGPFLLDDISADANGKLAIRIRLEARLTQEGGIPNIEEEIYALPTMAESPSVDDRLDFRQSTRNRFHVHYIPAHRDPAKELRSATSAILGRLISAVQWHGAANVQLKLQDASKQMASEIAIKEIQQALQSSWKSLNPLPSLTAINIDFLPHDITTIIQQAVVALSPDETGEAVDPSRLGDGHRSLLYLSAIDAMYKLQTQLSTRPRPAPDPWYPRKLPAPCFTLFAMEEPENHLSPHLLGRVVAQLRSMAHNTSSCQAVIATHSASLLSRVSPPSIRYLRHVRGISTFQTVDLPSNNTEAEKLISGTLRAYPELFFAKLVILGEGETERVVLPRLICPGDDANHEDRLAVSITQLDDLSVAVIPIGGRHVNYWWQLLYGLGIPCVTLLDLDSGRAHGGHHRVIYTLDQLHQWHSDPDVKAWAINEKENITKNHDSWTKTLPTLEDLNIFFSRPLDLDYSMLCSYPTAYRVFTHPEKGPAGESDMSEVEKAVFKTDGKRNADYSDDNALRWYRYLFLGNRGKPSTHIQALARIEEDHDWRNSMPAEIARLIAKIRGLIDVDITRT